MNQEGTPLGKATLWLKFSEPGQVLVAVPSLRLTQETCIRLSGGHGLGVFNKCYLQTAAWESKAVLVTGLFDMWRTGQPCLRDVGFVLGDTADIGRALTCMKKLLE